MKKLIKTAVMQLWRNRPAELVKGGLLGQYIRLRDKKRYAALKKLRGKKRMALVKIKKQRLKSLENNLMDKGWLATKFLAELKR